MRKVKWMAANGAAVEFGRSPPFILKSFFPGTPSATAEIVKGIRMDGQSTYHVTREPLTPSISGSVHGRGAGYGERQKDLDRLRIALQRAFDPAKFGTLVYTCYHGSYRLRCRPLAGCVFTERIGEALKLDVELISDAPFWERARPEIASAGGARKLWRFPWAIKPTVFGVVMSSGTVFNPSDLDIFPRIELSGTRSAWVTLSNGTTGEHLTVERPIEKGELIVIEGARVTAVGLDGSETDATQWLTHDSAMPFRLAPGCNEIRAEAEDPAWIPLVTVTWHLPEVGL